MPSAMARGLRGIHNQPPDQALVPPSYPAQWPAAFTAMAVASNIALTLKKLKASGEQRITIQHVNVSQGGQAVIGDVRAGGQ